MHEGAEGLGHRLGVDHRHHRNAEAAGDVGARGLAVEEPHHPFDEDQVGLARGLMQPPGGVGLAAHAQIEVVHRRTAGHRVDLRIEEIRPALEHPHPRPWRRAAGPAPR
jgi:hypothetical protein